MAPLKLHANPRRLHDAYRAGDPFPHVVIDGLFDDADLDRVLADVPRPEEMRWMRFDSPTEKKLGYFRVNMLVYLDKDWKEEWGGHLELWNANMT